MGQQAAALDQQSGTGWIQRHPARIRARGDEDLLIHAFRVLAGLCNAHRAFDDARAARRAHQHIRVRRGGVLGPQQIRVGQHLRPGERSAGSAIGHQPIRWGRHSPIFGKLFFPQTDQSGEVERRRTPFDEAKDLLDRQQEDVSLTLDHVQPGQLMPHRAEDVPRNAENLRSGEAEILPVAHGVAGMLQHPVVDELPCTLQMLVDDARRVVANLGLPCLQRTDVEGLRPHIARDRVDDERRILVQILFFELELVDAAEAVLVQILV